MARSTTTLLVLARRLGLLAILLVATFAIGTVDADAGVASQSPAADPARVRAHLVAFQDIADRHGGTRTTDTPGFAESRAYAVAALQQAGWQVAVQTFTLPGTVPTVPPTLAQVGPVPATYVLGTDYALTTPPSGDDADAPLALVGITGVPDPSDGGGACEPGAFDGFPPGAIALVVYGSCDPLVVVTSAFSAGATGVGFISQGFESARPYRRMPDSYHRRASWMFEGIEGEIIGDFGLAHEGAAGIEIDRYDLTLGTPPHTLIVAASGGHSDNYMLVCEEILYAYPGMTGTHDYRIRADITYFTAPHDGAVLSTGSIAFGQSLPFNNFDNNVSKLLKNIVDAFAKKGKLPGWAWTAEEKQWR